MSDDQRQEDRPQPPPERSPQGGSKDTDDLSDVKDVQRTGMLEKSRQVEQLPKGVVEGKE